MDRSFTWIVGFVTMIWISVPVSNTLGNSPVAPSDTSPVDNWWHYKGIYGEDIGGAYQKERLVVADIDGDGVVEILAGATLASDLDPADYFFIASHRPDTGEYPMDFLSPAIFEGAETIAAADVDGDGIWEVFLGHEMDVWDPEIRVLEGNPPMSVRTLDSSLYEVTTFRFLETTPGSSPWLLAADLWGKTAVFDTESWTLLAEIPYGAIDLEIGDVAGGGGDPELVYSSGEVVSFDGTAASLLYTFDWGDSTDVALIQLDGDPELEMVSGGGGEPVRAWDYGNPNPLWQLPQAADMIRAVDVTGDGSPEIILTTDVVTCIDPATQAVMWTYEPSGVGSDGIGSFAAADVDADGTIEMVIGTGIYSWDPKALFIVDAESQTEEWRTYQRDRAFFRSAQIADLDENGELEIVFATMFGEGGTHPPPWEGGWIHIMDARTHEETYYSQALLYPGVPTNKVLDIRIGDVDDDDDTELVVSTQLAGSTGHVLVYDAATMSKEAEYDFSFMASLLAMELGDVDNDGHTEIVGVTHSSSHPEHDNRIWVLDGATGVIEWASGELPGFTISDIEVGNLDSDSAIEMIAISNTSIFDKTVTIVDGISHDTWTSASDVYASVTTMDLDGSGRDTVLLGMDTGEVMALDDDGLGGFSQSFRVPAIDKEILAMAGYRLPGSGEPRLALTSGDGRLIGFDPATPAVVWQSDPILQYPGGFDAIDTEPIPTETGTMFLVGGAHTVYQFGGVVEPPTIQLSSASYTFGESNGQVAVVAQRLGNPEGEVAVDYATSDGTAVEGQDYSAVSASLVWPHLDTSDKTVLVPILDDDDSEGPESFAFTLFNPSGGVLGSPNAAIVTIEDDDVSTVAFSTAVAEVDETQATVMLSVGRTGDSSVAGSVNWATTDGTATAGEDYTSAGGTLDWAPGNGDDKTIMVAILDDALFEGPEAFTVTLSSPGGNAFLGEPYIATVNIGDNDTIEIVFSSGAYSADEGDGTPPSPPGGQARATGPSPPTSPSPTARRPAAATTPPSAVP